MLMTPPISLPVADFPANDTSLRFDQMFQSILILNKVDVEISSEKRTWKFLNSVENNINCALLNSYASRYSIVENMSRRSLSETLVVNSNDSRCVAMFPLRLVLQKHQDHRNLEEIIRTKTTI